MKKVSDKIKRNITVTILCDDEKEELSLRDCYEGLIRDLEQKGYEVLRNE